MCLGRLLGATHLSLTASLLNLHGTHPARRRPHPPWALGKSSQPLDRRSALAIVPLPPASSAGHRESLEARTLVVLAPPASLRDPRLAEGLAQSPLECGRMNERSVRQPSPNVLPCTVPLVISPDLNDEGSTKEWIWVQKIWVLLPPRINAELRQSADILICENRGFSSEKMGF